jgi:dTDP-4-amino-4,6-dideoxygalactose transaminase
MSYILAGIGRSQMKVLDNYVALRRKNNLFYQKLFNEVISAVSMFKEYSTDYFSNHWLSCVLIDEKNTGFTTQDLRLQLGKDNIESRLLWKPMHLQPVFKNYSYYGSNIAESLFKRGLCLPSGSNLTDEDRLRIANSIRKLIK